MVNTSGSGCKIYKNYVNRSGSGCSGLGVVATAHWAVAAAQVFPKLLPISR